MAQRLFRKRERLHKWREFLNVMNCGQNRRVGSYFTVFWMARSCGVGRLGVVASKKIGGAAVRNACKRRIREIYRCNKDKIKPAMDIVVVSGKGMINLPFSALERKITGIIQS